MPALTGISRAWVAAQAALPLGWELLGVVKGPRVADPQVNSPDWCAWAKPRSDAAASAGEAVAVGLGQTPEAALSRLAENLRR